MAGPRRAARDEADQKRRERRKELLAEYGADPYVDGTVLAFSKEFEATPGKVYDYAVIKANGFYYVTGRTDSHTWTDLLDFVDTDNVLEVHFDEAQFEDVDLDDDNDN